MTVAMSKETMSSALFPNGGRLDIIVARRITNHLKCGSNTRVGTRWVDRGRAGKATDVESVATVLTSFIGRLPNKDCVIPVFWSDNGNKSILFEKRCVVRGGHLKTSAIEDGNIGVEKDSPESHALDLGRNALAFFCADLVIIRILNARSAVNGRVKPNHLGFCVIIVRFNFLDGGKLTDPESAHVGNPSLAA